MAKTATINMRVEPELKEQAEEMFARWGLSLTEAINVFIHKSLDVGGLPFDLRDEQPNAVTLQAIREAEAMDKGTVPFQTYKTAEEMFAAFDREQDS